MGRLNLIERRIEHFMRQPPSVRNAAGVIVVATAVVTVGAGVLISLIDSDEYPNVGIGLWWAIQTVTTVGYGDVTPKEPSGRVVAAFVMLEGIAFLAIITAAITSTFVARAERERALAEGAAEADEELRLERSLGDVAERLDRMEATLRELAKASER